MSDRFGRQIVSWSCLIGGVLLLALVLLTPPWSGKAHLEVQRDQLAVQSQRLERMSLAYADMAEALETDDPVMIEHLAYRYLGLKPVGVDVLDAGQLLSMESRLQQMCQSHQAATVALGTPGANHLERITQGRLGSVLILLAGACLLIGLRQTYSARW